MHWQIVIYNIYKWLYSYTWTLYQLFLDDWVWMVACTYFTCYVVYTPIATNILQLIWIAFSYTVHYLQYLMIHYYTCHNLIQNSSLLWKQCISELILIIRPVYLGLYLYSAGKQHCFIIQKKKKQPCIIIAKPQLCFRRNQ